MVLFNQYRKLFVTIFLALIFSSCSTFIDWDKEIDSLINGQSYVIPIGETTLTLNDIISQLDSTHLKGGENYIFLEFKDTVVWNFRSIADFQNLIEINEVYSVPAGAIQNNSVSADFNRIVNLNFNSDADGQQIVRTEMNSAKVEITVETLNMNVDPSSILVTTTFQSDQLFFAQGGDISKGSGSKIVYQPTEFKTPKVINLNSFTLLTPNNLSTLNISVKVEVVAGHTPVVVLPNSQVLLKYKLYDVDTKVFYGKIKPSIANNVQGKTVDMAEYLLELPSKGVFKIAEPIIKFDLYNNSGVKINLMVDSIKAFKSDDPTFAPVYAKFNGSKTTSKVIDCIPSFPGLPIKTSYVLDHTLENGNISQFFDRYPLPDRLFYKFKLTNARADTDPLDFAAPTANLVALIDVKIPLKLNAGSNFEFVDTLENIDMNDLIDLQVVDQMLLVLKVTNNLPLKGKLSLKFLDSNKLPIADLKVLSDSIINAPLIDDNGVVQAGSNAISDLKVIVESSQLTKLRLAKNLVYTIKVESEENRKITLQKENYIKLKLGKYSKGE